MTEALNEATRADTQQTMAYSDSCRQSRQFHTVKKVSYSQYSYRLSIQLQMSIQLQTVKTASDSCRLSIQLQTAPDQCTMSVFVC